MPAAQCLHSHTFVDPNLVLCFALQVALRGKMNPVGCGHLVHPGISMGVGQEEGHVLTDAVADD